MEAFEEADLMLSMSLRHILLPITVLALIHPLDLSRLQQILCRSPWDPGQCSLRTRDMQLWRRTSDKSVDQANRVVILLAVIFVLPMEDPTAVKYLNLYYRMDAPCRCLISSLERAMGTEISMISSLQSAQSPYPKHWHHKELELGNDQRHMVLSQGHQAIQKKREVNARGLCRHHKKLMRIV